MSKAAEQWDARLAQLTEMLGLSCYELTITCDSQVKATDIKISVAAIGTGHRVDIPAAFDTGQFVRGDTITINLPIRVYGE